MPITVFTPQHLAYMAAWSVGLAIICVYRFIIWSIIMSVRNYDRKILSRIKILYFSVMRDKL